LTESRLSRICGHILLSVYINSVIAGWSTKSVEGARMTPFTSEPLWFGAVETRNRDVSCDKGTDNINVVEKYNTEWHSSVPVKRF
jgi:hypothetical protein